MNRLLSEHQGCQGIMLLRSCWKPNILHSGSTGPHSPMNSLDSKNTVDMHSMVALFVGNYIYLNGSLLTTYACLLHHLWMHSVNWLQSKTTTHPLTEWLTGEKCRATSVAKCRVFLSLWIESSPCAVSEGRKGRVGRIKVSIRNYVKEPRRGAMRV